MNDQEKEKLSRLFTLIDKHNMLSDYGLLPELPPKSEFRLFEDLNMLDFFIFLNKNGKEGNFQIKFITFHYWKHLNHQDFIKIIRNSHEIALYHFVPFLHTYLEISYINFILNDEQASEDRKNYIKRVFIPPKIEGMPRGILLTEDPEIDSLKIYDVSLEDLKEMKYRLISQGAEEADKDIYFLR